MNRDDRRHAHDTVAARLGTYGDEELSALLAGGEPHETGIGGSSVLLSVEGVRVFVKKIPLTDLEARPEHHRSTANLFGLPPFYQYGVGSAGFGAWRELAAHLMTTGWVLDGEHAGFPLLHHWRVLPGSAGADDGRSLDERVAYWDGSPAVRARLEAIAGSTASLVVFLEYFPHALYRWLPEQGPGAYARVEAELAATAAFMRDRGLVHFDAHYRNVVTDGRHHYLTDFGLAVGEDFDLSPGERAFLAVHRDYDLAYGAAHLVNHHIAARYRAGRGHGDFVAGWTRGERPADVPAPVAEILDRHAPTAVVMAGFLDRLIAGPKTTPYPVAELAAAAHGRASRAGAGG
ncbi:protein kinase family protein [Phytomonospora endophytica]|uniref:Protein kinase domain-containing protein n=1 Tax=Phytomonospora endophytica TaxID=714109 RepID=A0A841FBQ2_9ACTN|nr:protein kinase family protein [Phytomonospora endophytica]MBB6034711.1 hypothetical protein [Phytomonospora endophytica]GIG69087.1 hypothetical protein Pen01_53820 [Phytomonospora endophytica]